ncbi:MAG: hypothetical protein ACOC7X_02645 [Spirochaetota bacterium]
MKRNLLKTVNLFTLIALLALIGYTASVLISAYSQGTSDARFEITRLSAKAKTMLTLEQTEFDEHLTAFRRNLVDVPQIKSFILYNAEDELIYVYARNPHYVRIAGDSERLLRRSINLTYNTLFETSHTVRLPDDFRVFGEGVYQIISPASLLSLSTNIFYVLAALTLLLLVSLLCSGKHKSVTAGHEPEPPSVDNSIYESSTATSFKAEEESLYAPDSGLCFEQYLEERLSNELRRAAAFDEDLSVAFIQCGNAMEDRLTYIQLAQKLKDHFNFHDLLFELEHDKMAVILPNTDLEQGINELSDFQKDVYKESGEKLCTFDIRIGLSSRNGRLINSDRILKEVRAALRKAEHDIETNLVGFKPDPGKFRSFLASQAD